MSLAEARDIYEPQRPGCEPARQVLQAEARKDLIVLHDDIDVPFGKVKVKMGGGHGGNNGIRSIIAETGVKEFARIKLGVGRPQKPEDGDVSSWVLGRFTEGELSILKNEMLRDVMVRLDSLYKQKR